MYFVRLNRKPKSFLQYILLNLAAKTNLEFYLKNYKYIDYNFLIISIQNTALRCPYFDLKLTCSYSTCVTGAIVCKDAGNGGGRIPSMVISFVISDCRT